MSANIMAATSALPQVLYSGQMPNAEAALYTVPAATSVVLANASMCNVTAAAVTCSVAIVKSGGTVGDGTHKVVPITYSLAAGNTLPLKDLIGNHMLGPGDIVAGVAGAASSIDFILSGTVFT